MFYIESPLINQGEKKLWKWISLQLYCYTCKKWHSNANSNFDSINEVDKTTNFPLTRCLPIILPSPIFASIVNQINMQLSIIYSLRKWEHSTTSWVKGVVINPDYPCMFNSFSTQIWVIYFLFSEELSFFFLSWSYFFIIYCLVIHF